MKDLKIPRSDPREMSEELAKRLLRDVEWTMGNRMIFLMVNTPELNMSVSSLRLSNS